ncbi:MAG: carboxy-S-adenosyl-L-methionine synthase CmoA [Devosia sp.]
MKDEIFKNVNQVNDFKFDKDVVTVFDNMVTRSVPYYEEMQRMITELTKDFATPNSNVYDLGCSTGTTFINLDRMLDENISFVGIDNSTEMLEQCCINLDEHNVTRKVDLLEGDLNSGITLDNASVVIMCLTLQFVRPLYRNELIKSLYDQLNHNGCVILIEKTLGEESLFNRLFIKYYYDFKKRNQYSDIEIAQKREALENVLIPYKLMENRELLLRTGFKTCEVFFKWYNFSGIIAIKFKPSREAPRIGHGIPQIGNIGVVDARGDDILGGLPVPRDSPDRAGGGAQMAGDIEAHGILLYFSLGLYK